MYLKQIFKTFFFLLIVEISKTNSEVKINPQKMMLSIYRLLFRIFKWDIKHDFKSAWSYKGSAVGLFQTWISLLSVYHLIISIYLTLYYCKSISRKKYNFKYRVFFAFQKKFKTSNLEFWRYLKFHQSTLKFHLLFAFCSLQLITHTFIILSIFFLSF